MSADGAGDKGQRILLQNKLQGLGIFPLAAEFNVLRDVLADGAAALAWSGEAVDKGHLLIELPPGQGLDSLDVVLVAANREGKRLHLLRIHGGEGFKSQRLQLLADLLEALITAGLQLGGSHSDGPDAALEELIDVKEVRAAGVAQAQTAIELPADPPGHLDGQGEQALARHVHLLAGQLILLHVHRESVGELQAEFQAVLPRQSQQPAEHRDSVGILQILIEVVFIESDIVVAHTVQDGAGGFVAQDSGVALNKGVQMLFRDKVGRDALDLVRRAAVESGDGDAVGDPGTDGINERRLGGEHLFQNPLALLIDRGLGGILHLVEVLVDLGALDALQVIAHGHVENKPVRVSQTAGLRQYLAGKPGLDVLLIGLRHVEFRGPLAVITLVLRQDAGAVDTGGQLRAVHLLYSLQLKEPGSGEIGGDDILCQLGIGPGGRAKGRLNFFPAKDGEGFLSRYVRAVDAEDGTLPVVLGGEPVHQFLKRNGDH